MRSGGRRGRRRGTQDRRGRRRGARDRRVTAWRERRREGRRPCRGGSPTTTPMRPDDDSEAGREAGGAGSARGRSSLPRSAVLLPELRGSRQGSAQGGEGTTGSRRPRSARRTGAGWTRLLRLAFGSRGPAFNLPRTYGKPPCLRTRAGRPAAAAPLRCADMGRGGERGRGPGAVAPAAASQPARLVARWRAVARWALAHCR